MVDFNGILDSIFNVLHGITLGLREFVGNMLPDYALLILLGLSILGGYYLNQKYPNIVQKYGVVWLVLVFYLILRFV